MSDKTNAVESPIMSKSRIIFTREGKKIHEAHSPILVERTPSRFLYEFKSEPVTVLTVMMSRY